MVESAHSSTYVCMYQKKITLLSRQEFFYQDKPKDYWQSHLIFSVRTAKYFKLKMKKWLQYFNYGFIVASEKVADISYFFPKIKTTQIANRRNEQD